MSAESITILSGVALLAVFALVGWNVRRNRARGKHFRWRLEGRK